MSLTKKNTTLRDKLKKVINKALKNDELKKKELACFDSLISRRSFLSNSGKIATLGALVSSGMMPSAWGQLIPEYGSNPADFGITEADINDEITAYTLNYGTEMYTQVVSESEFKAPGIGELPDRGHAANNICALEGFNYGQLKLQSDLETNSPTEDQFTDIDNNYGSLEMARAIPDGNGLGIEIIEHNSNEQDDEDNQGGGFVTSLIPNSAFRYGLIDNGGCGQFFTLKSLTHPLHNRVTEDGKNMLGVQAMVVNDSAPRHAYVCARWMTAEASFERTRGVTTGWDVISFANIFPILNRTDNEIWTDFEADSYTDVTGKSYITLCCNHHLFVVCIEGYKSISAYHLSASKMSGNITLEHVQDDRNGDKTFYVRTDNSISNANYPNQRLTIKFSPSNSTGSNTSLSFGNTSITVNERSVASSDTDAIIKPYGLDNLYYAHDIERIHHSYELGQVNGIYTDPYNPNNTHAISAIAKICIVDFKSASYEGYSNTRFVAMTAHDIGTGQLVAIMPFLPLNLSNLGNIIKLTGGKNKYGGFTFYSLDNLGNVQMYRQRVEDQNSDTPYQPATGYGRLVSPHDAGKVCLDFMNAPSFECERLRTFDNGAASEEQSGFYLGDGFIDIQCNPRFNQCSEYVAYEFNGDSDKMGAFMVYNQMVEKTWITTPITIAMGLDEAEQNDEENYVTKSCYQAVIKPANGYGSDVVLGENQYLEIRGSAPTKITVNEGRCYAIDRTQGALVREEGCDVYKIKILAEDVTCQLMARVVDVGSLNRSNYDNAMFTDTNGDGVSSAWFSIILSQDSTERLASDDYNNEDLVRQEINNQNIQISDTLEDGEDPSQYVSETAKASAATMTTMVEPTVKSTNFMSSVSSLTSGVDPLYTLHVRSSDNYQSGGGNTRYSSSSTQVCAYEFKNGVLRKTTAFTVSSNGYQSFWKKSKKFLSDAMHTAKRTAKKTMKDIKGSMSFSVDPFTGLVSFRATWDLLDMLGNALDIGGPGDWIESALETLEDVGNFLWKNVGLVIISPVLLIIKLIDMLLHLQDMIKCIQSSQSTTKALMNSMPSQASSVKSKQEAYQNKTLTAYNENPQEQGRGHGEESQQDSDINLQKQLKKITNNPFVHDFIVKPFQELSKTIGKVAGGAVNVLSPIVIDDINVSSLDDLYTLFDSNPLETISSSTVLNNVINNIGKYTSDPSQAVDLTCDNIAELKKFPSSLNAITSFLTLSDGIIDTGLDATKTLWGSKSIKIQIPVLSAFLKLFDIDLSLKLSLSDLHGMFFGAFYWVYKYISTGKSVTSLPPLPSQSNNYMQEQLPNGQYGDYTDDFLTNVSYYSTAMNFLWPVLWGAKKVVSEEVKAQNESLFDMFDIVADALTMAYAQIKVLKWAYKASNDDVDYYDTMSLLCWESLYLASTFRKGQSKDYKHFVKCAKLFQRVCSFCMKIYEFDESYRDYGQNKRDRQIAANLFSMSCDIAGIVRYLYDLYTNQFGPSDPIVPKCIMGYGIFAATANAIGVAIKPS